MPPKQTTDSERKKSPSFHQIIAEMLDPSAGVQALRGMPIQPSRHTLLRSGINLRQRKRHDLADALGLYIEEIYPRKKQIDRRPKEGDSRRYKVWQQDGILYTRVPVASLGVVKGDNVDIAFGDGEIRLSKSAKKSKKAAA